LIGFGNKGLRVCKKPDTFNDCAPQNVNVLDSLVGIPAGNEEFIALCQKAEDVMDMCVLAETSEEFGNALSYCQQAIDFLKSAMRLPNLGQTSHTFAQRKSNACLIKMRTLQKRLIARQESNQSNTSSDSGINTDYR